MDKVPQRSRENEDLIDQALLRRVSEERDSHALQTLYERFAPRVIGFLRRLTNDSGLIEEVYNDVMMTVWEKAHQYRSESKASSWVFSIAYRRCLRLVKKQNFRSGVLRMLGQETNEPTSRGNAEVDESDLIEAALQRLSAPHRLVVELTYFRDFSTQEVADIVDCPANTVKTRLFHARKQIRTFVERQGVSA
ncbi:MAG: RNA polymerase sigma factor [Pseudomonadota bacterium]